MPLVRSQLRNEFRLGQPELYKQADRDDPKALLDGVSVSGLVGILRQLGDLAEFAAEVFHGLQEQVMTTASRSHKLMIRVQQIEAALPPLEKAAFSQTSHIHFAYTAGSEWHPRLQNAKNHFIYNDLPQFMMDSYEDCRGPPRFDLLDKFDMGGPGSCLKRYSDPTFFKRVSGSSIEANIADKVQGSKRAHKSKKRSSLRNGELSRAPSIYSCSGRMRFTSPIVNKQTSPPQTASTVDMEMKYDLQEHSNFFDLKAGSGHINCVFDVSSSMQPEKQEATSSRMVLNSADNPAKDFPVQQTQFVDDDFSVSSSQEQIAQSLSYVTWDEKAEIVESRGRHFDRNEFPEVNFDLDMQDRDHANLRHFDQMDILLNGSDSPESISSRNQVDEIESETEDYLDALNTIESESEVDTEFQIKQGVDQYSRDVNNKNREDGINVLKATNAEHQSSKNESDAASNILTNDGVSRSLPESVPTECLAGKQIPPFSCKSFDSDHSSGTDLFINAEFLQGSKAESVAGDPSSGSRVNNLHGSPCDTMINTVQEFPEPHPEISGVPSIKIQTNGEIAQGSKVESVAVDPSSSGSRVTNSQVPPCDIMVDSVCESPKSHPKISSVPSVKIWTNGGLLGLEPSKPPDFSVGLNSISRSGRTVDPPNNLLTTKSDGLKEKQGTFVKDAENNGKPSGLTASNVSVPLADLHAKVEKRDYSHGSNSHNCAYDSGPSLNTEIPNGNKLLVNPNVNSKPVESDQCKDDTAMFPLGHRLLVSSFCRNVSLNNDIKSEPANPLKACVMEQKSEEHSLLYQKILEEQFGSRSPAHSLTSSPPLGHMKISFNPIHGFETHKLKLKFPDGIHSHESNRDMFPSFQLVPEPVISVCDVASDSGDDTFCRSSHYLSDDCLSNYSESNFEQWESGKTAEQSDQELYDALSRMSSMESVSSSLYDGKAANNGIYINGGLKPMASESGAEPSVPVPSLDLPSFDAINQVVPEETNSNTTNNVSELQNSREPEPIPLPPPLPSAQWQVSTPGLNIGEGRQKTLSESLRQELDLKLLGSAVSHKPNPASTNQQKINEEAAAFKLENKQLDQQKLNRQRGANQAVNGKMMDEKDDFLQQIRTKSFNLRRTVTAKPTVTSGPTANVKVTAILEKANAIRQAVGSDDDEDDDNWSES
ncbi:hypothetical protein SLEP1_g7903 [Rubroshorea leprosula]|uniref:Protein SCAR n=1 Tax=Rubroshorea leprosula TaxID=152421 RepID=A0AAV5HZW9_9ROSI|nr:hypothetical protein SLEP1_g7903 [Rubroshorea leprosula]